MKVVNQRDDKNKLIIVNKINGTVQYFNRVKLEAT